MKIFLAFTALLAAVAGVPEPITKANERFVDGIIVGLIEDLSNDIKERGLDPVDIKAADFDYKLPVTDLLIVEAALEDLLVEGLSNIVINRISFSLLTTRLQLDISLPLISAKLASSNANVKLFSSNLSGQASGSLVIEDIRVEADVRVSIGIISGISVSSVTVNFTIKGINSNLNVIVFGHDLSESLNKFLGETIPTTLAEHRSEINALLEHIVREVVNGIL